MKTAKVSDALDNRVFYVDFIRALASVLVVISHVFAPVCAGMNTYPPAIWWFFNIFDSVIRICVPLYVMISGKLLLGSTREEPYERFVWRRYRRLIIPFFVWSMIYAYYESRLDGSPFVFGHAVLQFIQGPTEYHLWFMYMILALYLLAPFIRRFCKAASQREITIVLLLWFLFLIVEFLFPSYIGVSPAVTLSNYGGYFILGYYLDHYRMARGQQDWLGLAAIFLILFNACGTYFRTLANGGTLDETFFVGRAPLVALYAAIFFLMLRNADYTKILTHFPSLRKIVRKLSQLSYNVYLIHAFFIWLFMYGDLGFKLSADTSPTPLIGIPLTAITVCCCSWGLSLFLMRIPVLSRFFVTVP